MPPPGRVQWPERQRPPIPLPMTTTSYSSSLDSLRTFILNQPMLQRAGYISLSQQEWYEFNARVECESISIDQRLRFASRCSRGRRMEETGKLPFLLSSTDRLKLLSTLSEGKLRSSRLSSKLSITAQETYRQLSRLRAANLVERASQGLYGLTGFGRVVLKLLPRWLEFTRCSRCW